MRIILIILSLWLLPACKRGKQATATDVMRVDTATLVLPVPDTMPIETDTVIAVIDLPAENPVVTPIIIQEYDPRIIRMGVVNTYNTQVGVREKTGNNDGKEVEAYLKTVGLGKGYAWCAAYVKYCLLKGGASQAKSINAMALSVHDKKRLVYFQGRYSREPQPGDAFTLYYVKLKRIGHTGFFDGWTDRSMGAYRSNEGNTNGGGSRDGDGTYRRIRQLGGTYSINNWID